jgi:hypothetical protein
VVAWLLGFIVLFLIEFKQIKEIYNNPTPKMLGFLLEKNYLFTKISQIVIQN